MATQHEPHLPHDRDETSATRDAPHPEMEQALKDIESGQVDTDLRQTPGLDAGHRPETAADHLKDGAKGG